MVDPTTQRSLVVRQSDEGQMFSSDVLIKLQSAICPPCSTPSPRQSSELKSSPPLQGIVLFGGFDRQSPVRQCRGRRKRGPPKAWPRIGILWGIIALRVRWPATILLRDSRGKEENLQIRRLSGSHLHFWMAVQPPVNSIVYAVSPPLHVPPTSPFNSTFHFPRTWVNRHAAHAAPPF